MGKIQQLSPHVADLIAAGEVVERPASAAKELVENAIDAGAKNITVEIQDGGMRYLRVTDDGCGMSPEDAETAFLRHATSKLRSPEDLEAITTLGFRGEALAAISAVSRIDLLTRTQDATYGVSLHLEAGQITEKSEAGYPKGTTIILRDIFYNTPARMKFMRRDAIEAGTLLSAVQRLALAHPEVSIRLLRDGEEQLRTPGDGQLLSAIYAVMGKVTAKEMLPMESRWDKYSLSGYVSTPTASRGNRNNEIFLVNGRHVRSKTMIAALEEAYRNSIMVGRFPSCVLHLRLPEHLVDVNVHPAKIEVKFLNEKDVYDCIYYGVKGALEKAAGKVALRMAPRPKESFTAQGSPQQFSSPVAQEARPAPQPPTGKAPSSGKAIPRQDFYKSMSSEEFLDFAKLLKEAPVPTGSQAEKNFRAILAQGEKELGKAPQKSTEPPAEKPAVKEKTPAELPREEPRQEVLPEMAPEQKTLDLPEQDYKIIGEALSTYILVEQNGSLLFIDKHAAHERILFEKFRSKQEPIMPQLLLEPLLCRLGPEEAALLLENEGFLSEYGFNLSDFGDGVLSLSQIPADLDPEEAEATLSQLASDLQKGKRTEKAALRDTLLHTLACKAAIKGGRHSDPRELEALVSQVLSREDIKYCPHGRPICAVLSKSQLERQFKRT